MNAPDWKAIQREAERLTLISEHDRRGAALQRRDPPPRYHLASAATGHSCRWLAIVVIDPDWPDLPVEFEVGDPDAPRMLNARSRGIDRVVLRSIPLRAGRTLRSAFQRERDVYLRYIDGLLGSDRQ